MYAIIDDESTQLILSIPSSTFLQVYYIPWFQVLASSHWTASSSSHSPSVFPIFLFSLYNLLLSSSFHSFLHSCSVLFQWYMLLILLSLLLPSSSQKKKKKNFKQASSINWYIIDCQQKVKYLMHKR